MAFMIRNTIIKEKYDIIEDIGEGTFSTVVKAKLKENGQLYSISFY